MQNAFIISEEKYSEEINQLKSSLAALNLNHNEIMFAQLLVEEIFLSFKSVSAETEDFYANISIKKRFGNVNIEISSKDEPFNPLKNLSDYNIDDDDYFNVQILKNNIDKLKYYRANGKNIISIKIREVYNKYIKNTVTGLILGIIIGLFLKTFVSFEVNDWIVENIIDSLQIIFINALTMVIAPMIFFSIIDGIINMSDATYIG